MNVFINSYIIICDQLAISFPRMCMIRLYLKKTKFWPVLSSLFGHFGIFWAENKHFKHVLRKLWSPCHKLSNDIWYDYIWRKPIFTHFWSIFGPFRAILGLEMKIFKHLYENCDHLAISFPTIYDMTIFEENQFFTIFGLFLVHLGPFWA